MRQGGSFDRYSSFAQMQVAEILTLRGLNPINDYPIMLLVANSDFHFDEKNAIIEKPYRQVEIFIDGPPHEKRSARQYDEDVQAFLEKRGVAVLRFPHSGRFSIERLKQVREEISLYVSVRV